jgi:Kef-type K+ transport system membrane component KefB
LQGVSPITWLPLPLYFAILIFSIFVIFLLIPVFTKFVIQKQFSARELYEKQLRFVIVLVIALLAYFLFLGVHPILAAFIIGLTLSKVIKSKIILNKLNTLGYGFFVPIFFFIIGMQMNLSIFMHFGVGTSIILAIILGLIFSKFGSGYLAGRLIKISPKYSSVFGISSTIQLTTTLAVVYIAATLNLFDSTLVTAIIALSIVTTIVSPVLLKLILTPKK